MMMLMRMCIDDAECLTPTPPRLCCLFFCRSLEGAPLASSGIFDEIPVCLYNSPLARGLLYDFQETGDIVDCDFDRLDLTSNPQLVLRHNSLSQTLPPSLLSLTNCVCLCVCFGDTHRRRRCKS